MKTNQHELIAACLAVLMGMQLTLLAQTDQSQAPPSGQSTSRPGQTASSSHNDVRLSKLIGADVKSNDGQDLGKVKDVLVNPQTGKPTSAIIGKGGVLGFGENRRQFP